MNKLVATIILLLFTPLGTDAADEDIVRDLAKEKIYVLQGQGPNGITRVEIIRINNKVIDSSLGKLCELKRLDALCIADATITVHGMHHIGGLTSLKYLAIIDITLTDGGLKELTGLRNLKVLDLNKCYGVTDAGIEGLCNCRELTHLDVSETSVTRSGVIRLKKALPDCEILASHLKPLQEL